MSNLCDDGYIYFNNDFFKGRREVISPDDRGFRYGDGVFETVRVSGGELFRINSHLERLKLGLESIKINFDVEGIENICKELLIKNKIKEGFIRIAISRGVGSEGYLPKCDKPTLLIQTIIRESQNKEPIDLWLSSYRKIPDICIPSDIKSAQGLNSTLARMQAKENSCFEALLLSVEGNICEGSSGNIFWFSADKLYTPQNNVLKGVMRQAVIDSSPYELVSGDFVLEDLKAAEEVFITNVAWGLKTVKSLQPDKVVWKDNRVSEEITKLIFN